MAENDQIPSVRNAAQEAVSSNVKKALKSSRYDRFGETIRYLTVEELQQFFNVIEDYRHKLMLQVIYELGCRVGEFVRIQLKHLSFNRCAVYFPAENTKTRARRVSHLPLGLMNELKGLLRQQGRMARRSERIYHPDEFLFGRTSNQKGRYSENRLRQIFQQYLQRAELSREYGRDRRGRVLHEITIHSLRHSHIMHYVHVYKLPLPVVQKQVGHKSLKTTSVYLRPSDEHVGQAYAQARAQHVPLTGQAKGLNTQELLSFQNDNPK
jgi:integrase/recombinase XerD